MTVLWRDREPSICLDLETGPTSEMLEAWKTPGELLPFSPCLKSKKLVSGVSRGWWGQQEAAEAGR